MIWKYDGCEYYIIDRTSMKIREICRYANCTNSEHWNEEFTPYVPLNARASISSFQSRVAVDLRITPPKSHSDTQVGTTRNRAGSQ
jgi:hypothetical protein